MRSLLLLWGALTGLVEGFFAAQSYALPTISHRVLIFLLVWISYLAAGLAAGMAARLLCRPVRPGSRLRGLLESSAGMLWGTLYFAGAALIFVHYVLRNFEPRVLGGPMPIVGLAAMAVPAWAVTRVFRGLRERLPAPATSRGRRIFVAMVLASGITSAGALLTMTQGRLALAQRTTLSGNLFLMAAVRASLPSEMARLPSGSSYREASRAFGSVGESPPAPSQERPHLILISVDTLRADHLATYGYPVITSPSLDRLADRSVVFEAAIVQRPTTAPSMATIFTGQYPWRHGLRRIGDVLPDEALTLAEVLEAAGYHGEAVVRNPQLTVDFGFAQGFTDYRSVLTRGNQPDEETIDIALQWLEEEGRSLFDEQPVFLWVHLLAPHAPYDEMGLSLDREPPGFSLAPPRHLGYPIWQNNEGFIGLNLNRYLELYDEAIYFTDMQIGRLLDKLEGLGILEESVVVFTSDHGESFGEMDYFSHGFTASDSEIRVPLYIRLPRGEMGDLRIQTVVQSTDLLPTLLALLGIRVDLPASDGRSLLPLMRHAASGLSQPPGFAYSETGLVGKLRAAPRVAMRTEDWLYIYDPVLRTDEKYRIQGDPASRRWRNEFDRAMDGEVAGYLRSYVRDFGTWAPLAPTALPDQVQEQLRSLGYLQ
jgi:arylsulfatase A-like enzyme